MQLKLYSILTSTVNTIKEQPGNPRLKSTLIPQNVLG